MFSELEPTFLYLDVSPNVLLHDDDVVADEWEVEGRNVYRGARDPHYTHANVYWLYDDHLQRVGLTEHDLDDPARYKTLWFHDDDFSTLFQENWEIEGDIWSKLPETTFERFLAEGWTTPTAFLEHCLQGPVRVLTAKMLLTLPKVYECSDCKKRSLHAFACGKERPLDFPEKGKIWFLDEDMLVCVPPSHSRVFTWLQLADDGDSSEQRVSQQALEQEVPTESQPSAPGTPLPSPPQQEQVP